LIDFICKAQTQCKDNKTVWQEEKCIICHKTKQISSRTQDKNTFHCDEVNVIKP